MKTKNINKAGATILSLPFILGMSPIDKPKEDKTKSSPNILIVLVDDMGYGHLGANYENYDESNVNQDILARSNSRRDSYSLEMAIEATQNSMPTLQKLVSEGVRFTDSHVANSLSAPSRAGILTGMYPQRFGIYNNTDMNSNGVPEDELLLPELFQDNGYKTAMFGKWHIGRYDQEKSGFAYDGQHPNDRGFDYYFGFNKSGTQYYESEILFRNKTRAKAEGYLTDQLTNEARSYIEKLDNDDQFFIYLAYNCPHGPLNQFAPEEYDSKFQELPKVLRIWNSYMFAVDEGIRHIMKTLEEKNMLDNTLIVFLSDNGASGGTPLPANGYYRSHKGSLYMGGTRSGMMAWWPGKIPAGSVCEQLISSMDVIPTCLDACNIDIPKSADLNGKSMLPLITGKSKKAIHENLVWANRNSLSWSYPGDKNRNVPAAWTIKNDEWILHYWSGKDEFTLYNCRTDIAERNDVSDSNPDIVKQMADDYASRFKTFVPPLTWENDVWYGLKPKDQLTKEEATALKQKNELLMSGEPVKRRR